MHRSRHPSMYGPNRYPRRLRYGPKIQDEVTGYWTNEKRLVVDPYGNRVDPRFGMDVAYFVGATDNR